ncbi:FG-GAP repeat protein [Streptomyces sp. NPDC096354]|uniref:FG-GAP repeat protein n=1 Tax=Streptomyces sp. NPDC096354 TaxID=3366088 RepID=UPI0038047CD4
MRERATVALTAATSGVPGSDEKNDAFSSVLASGDLNNDGYTDLVIRSGREEVRHRPQRVRGRYHCEVVSIRHEH